MTSRISEWTQRLLRGTQMPYYEQSDRDQEAKDADFARRQDLYRLTGDYISRADDDRYLKVPPPSPFRDDEDDDDQRLH
jgi:hypothetical protein